MTFDQFYRDSGVYPHFGSHEWLTMGASHSNRRSPAFGLNTQPPRELWPNAVPLFRVVEHLRERAESRISLVSVYRSRAYNNAIAGAADRSQHLNFKAADLVPLDITPYQLWHVCQKARAEGLWKGGIGKYPTFVHVDVRGKNADW